MLTGSREKVVNEMGGGRERWMIFIAVISYSFANFALFQLKQLNIGGSVVLYC